MQIHYNYKSNSNSLGTPVAGRSHNSSLASEPPAGGNEPGESFQTVAMRETFLCPAQFRTLAHSFSSRCGDALRIAAWGAGGLLGGTTIGAVAGAVGSPGVGFGLGLAACLSSGKDAGFGAMLPVIGFTGFGLVAPSIGVGNPTAITITGGILGLTSMYVFAKQELECLPVRQ